MRKSILIEKVLCVIALLAIAGCTVFAFCGCQTRMTVEKYPAEALPVYKVVTVNGVETLSVVDYYIKSGGWLFTYRSPLFAKEQLRGFHTEVLTNGAFCASVDTYERDLSTNSIVMVRTIFDGSANLAAAVAKAYATISTGGSSDAAGAIVAKIVNYFKSKGGDSSKSTVSSDGQKLTVTDGTTCISCDADGNCTDCSYTP